MQAIVCLVCARASVRGPPLPAPGRSRPAARHRPTRGLAHSSPRLGPRDLAKAPKSSFKRLNFEHQDPDSGPAQAPPFLPGPRFSSLPGTYLPFLGLFPGLLPCGYIHPMNPGSSFQTYLGGCILCDARRGSQVPSPSGVPQPPLT